MHILDILSSPKPSLSFEFFPPRAAAAWDELYETIQNWKLSLPPSSPSPMGLAVALVNSLTISSSASKTQPISLPSPTSPVSDTQKQKLTISSIATLRLAFQISSPYAETHQKTNPTTIGLRAISATLLTLSLTSKISTTPDATQTLVDSESASQAFLKDIRPHQIGLMNSST